MTRFATYVLALFVVACGGGQSEAEQPKAERLSAGEKCIRAANIKQTPPLDAPQRIDVSHIVIKHDQVKGAIKANISRTREAACLRAQKAREFLLSSNDWEAGYKKYSDEHGAMGGDLNDIGQGDTEAAFSNAAFSLKVDELSHVVETPRGFHIILRRK
jgi:NIMA-interacting peptidyl-prolyl cis-trans isomerase 1